MTKLRSNKEIRKNHSKRKNKSQTFYPALLRGKPNHANLDELLKVRLTEDGRPLLEKFYPAIDHGKGYLEYVSREMTPGFSELTLQDQWQPNLPTSRKGLILSSTATGPQDTLRALLSGRHCTTVLKWREYILPPARGEKKEEALCLRTI